MVTWTPATPLLPFFRRDNSMREVPSTRKVLSTAFIIGILVFGNSSASAFYYYGRYSCKICSGSCFFTSTEVLVPRDLGVYTSGTQTIYGSDGSFPSSGCAYTLDTTASSYSVNYTTGVGTETLSWRAAAANPAGCPGNYQDQTSIVLKPGSTSSSTNVVDNNLAAEAVPGIGDCSQ